MARQPALALDRLDHRGFFAADVSAGAAAQVQPRVLGKAGRDHLLEFPLQQQPHLGIFVAHIDVGVGRLDHPGGDQHAFDEAMRILLEVAPVLERAGLAFVAVDREHPRSRLGAYQRPLPSGREAGAAEAAQAGVADDLDQVVAGALAGQAIGEQRVTAIRAVARQIVLGCEGMRMRRRFAIEAIVSGVAPNTCI